MNAPSTCTQALLEVTQLEVAYGRSKALNEVSLRVAPGELVTAIGPSGAGKSTLLIALMGVLPTCGGEVRFAGERLPSGAIGARVTRGLALVPEQRALFGSMSVADNLALGAYRLRGQAKAQQASALEEVHSLFPRLKERHGQLASTLSGGERQMLALGRALMGRPRLLMLDEPSLGLAPLVVQEIFRIIDTLRQRHVAILLVEQNARAALRLAQRGYVLELGQIALEGPAAQLAQDPKIVEAYLGVGAHQDRLAA